MVFAPPPPTPPPPPPPPSSRSADQRPCHRGCSHHAGFVRLRVLLPRGDVLNSTRRHRTHPRRVRVVHPASHHGACPILRNAVRGQEVHGHGGPSRQAGEVLANPSRGTCPISQLACSCCPARRSPSKREHSLSSSPSLPPSALCPLPLAHDLHRLPRLWRRLRWNLRRGGW
jgi:hypothetical protein